MSIDHLFSKFVLFHMAAVCSTNRWFAISKTTGKWCFKVLLIWLVIEDQSTCNFLLTLSLKWKKKTWQLSVIFAPCVQWNKSNLNVFSALQTLLRICRSSKYHLNTPLFLKEAKSYSFSFLSSSKVFVPHYSQAALSYSLIVWIFYLLVISRK